MSHKGKHGHGKGGHGHGKGGERPIGMVKHRSMLAERLVLLVVAFVLIGLGIFLYTQFFG